MTRQSRKASLVESITHRFVGFVIMMFANWLVLPLFGFIVSMKQSAVLTAVFVGIATVHGYLLRRLFENLRVKGILP